jgi:hypothetical protein
MKHPQLNLTMSVLEHMMKTPAIYNEFGFVQAAARNWKTGDGIAKRSGCGKCRNRRPGKVTRIKVLDMARGAIVGLPRQNLERLKDLLNTEKIVLYFLVQGKQVKREV